MIRKLIQFGVLASAVVVGACNDNSLAVTNPNAGDTKRVLGSPTDAENLLGSYFKRWIVGMYSSTTDIEGMANIFSLMNMSSLANNCQNSHYPFSTSTNFNTPGNTCFGEQDRLYAIMGEVNRVASSFLTAEAGGLTLGSTARDTRDKAFAEFLNGVSIGYAALWYDSLGVVSTNQSTQDPGKLISFKAAGDSAMAHFQNAIDLANASPAAADGFPIPATWIPSPTSYSQAEFIKLVRSYRARIRANLARTPTDRAAVDWTSVIADAQAGISTDEEVTSNTTNGPSMSGWRSQYDAFTTWHQMPPFIIGMADTSGAYAAWIAQDLGARGGGNNNFFMATPDLRYPQGDNRTNQQNDFKIQSCEVPVTPPTYSCKRYFVNRPAANDQFTGPGWGFSQYDFARFHGWVNKGDAGSGRNGTTPIFVKTEIDMLQAEGLYRQGNYAGAVALVNVSRTRNGLPAITATDATTPVPGSSATCIPKVPVGPSFKTVACGKLLDAIKYEKYIETAYTSYSPWFLDMRGWGDLPANSPLYWATPYQDIQARGLPVSAIYGTGPGAGNAPNSVAVGPTTYGW
jgi:hypothetical protein